MQAEYLLRQQESVTKLQQQDYITTQQHEPPQQLTYQYLIEQIQTGTAETIIQTIITIRTQLFWLNQLRQGSSNKYDEDCRVLEKVLVGLLGHEYIEIRSEAARLLNSLYDGTNWAYEHPFQVKIGYVNDSFQLQLSIEMNDDPKPILLIELCAPSFDPHSNQQNLITIHEIEQIVHIENTVTVQIQFTNFPKPGFYDWRLVMLQGTTLVPILQQEVPIQGRFIVHPASFKKEIFHEIIVDMESEYLRHCTNEEYEIKEKVRGNFDDIVKQMEEYKRNGTSSLYILGAMERDNGYNPTTKEFSMPNASPMAVSSRRIFNRMLGGDQGFSMILARASELGIRILVQCPSSISASRPHTSYKKNFVSYVNDSGETVYHRGTDGKENQWEDQLLPNYRQLDSWELLIDDIVFLNSKGIHGIVLQDAQSWPIILAGNKDELSRIEADGTTCYSIQECFEGSVVLQNCPEGFWETGAISSLYPNPLLVKLVRKVWQKDPNFVVVGDCCWNREKTVVCSGVIPKSIDLPSAIASACGKTIDKEGEVTESLRHKLELKSQTILDFFKNQQELPQGAINLAIRSICGDKLPYPSLIYQQDSWNAVDLMYFLPGVPMTFGAEREGQCYRVELANVYKKKTTEIASRPTISVDTLSINTIPLTTNRMERSASTDSLQALLMDNDDMVYSTIGRSSSTTHVKKVENVPPRVHSWANLSGGLDSLDLLEDRLSFIALEEKAKQNIGPQYGFDISKISYHYQHRLNLRRSYASLHNGEFMALTAYLPGSGNVHPNIVCFARWSSNSHQFSDEYMVVASNFSNGPEEFWNILSEEDHAKHYYSMEEICFGKLSMKLKPHSSLCYQLIPHIGKDPNDVEEILSQSALLRLSEVFCSLSDKMEGIRAKQEADAEYLLSVCGGNYLFRRLLSVFRNDSSDDTIQLFHKVLKPLESKWYKLNENSSGLERVLRWVLCLVVQEAKRSISNSIEDKDVISWLRILSGKKLSKKFEVSESNLVSLDLMKFVNVSPSVANIVDMDKPQPTVQPVSHCFAASVLGAPPDDSNVYSKIIESNNIGKLVFLSPELGKWSTVGGLGVMVDELTIGLCQLGVDVTVISPFYNRNRKGHTNYLHYDGIQWTKNIRIQVGGEPVDIGIHEGRVQGVHVIFMHHEDIFPCVYPPGNASQQVRLLTVFAKASLEVLCQSRRIPSLIITNDWMTGFVSSYARSGHFGNPSVFSQTSFFHIVHNLDMKYEGRQYPADHDGDMYAVHKLPIDVLVDPYWGGQRVINPSRAALLSSNSWATVSKSYREELLNHSPLAPLLKSARYPFAQSNGIPVIMRRSRLLHLKCNTHLHAKAELQRRYFHLKEADMSIPILSFVGRITEQKGVHLILDCVEHLIHSNRGKIQVIVGGPISPGDPYGNRCAEKINYLRNKYPHGFWADPNAFFTDGPMVNLGSDFGLMPSLFEPGGIVQHEYFVGGTPVICYKTGGLKDSVFEFDSSNLTGNGMTFENYGLDDFLYAIHRGLTVFHSSETCGRLSLYEQLRLNAANSPLDVSVVARHWLKEFCRLRGVLYDRTCTVFRYEGPHRGKLSVVELIGSFVSWDKEKTIPMEHNDITNSFTIALYFDLPGTYTYKFIVDGKWLCSSGYPTIPDSQGILNNVITIPG